MLQIYQLFEIVFIQIFYHLLFKKHICITILFFIYFFKFISFLLFIFYFCWCTLAEIYEDRQPSKVQVTE